ncbi:putative double-strand break repair protein [Pseudoalteromonas virus vB_PspP-H6/1]|nr:putative double-strand break repair protein [Pseudoalteromonas virus vB_PspP-H6/1]
MSDLAKRLSDPFNEGDIEWRVQQSGISGKGKPWVMVIPYITNRAIQKRLDDVFTPMGWKNEYKPVGDKGFICGVSANVDGEWVTKWDGAECSNIEPLKGGLSGAMKRAAVQWGIGRYLYSLSEKFAVCRLCDSRFNASGEYISIKNKQGGQSIGAEWFKPDLELWALPSFEAEKLTDRMDSSKNATELKDAFSDAHSYASNFGRDDLMDKFTEVKDKNKIRLKMEVCKGIDGENGLHKWLDSQLSSASNVKNGESKAAVLIKISTECLEKCSLMGVKFEAFKAKIEQERAK